MFSLAPQLHACSALSFWLKAQIFRFLRAPYSRSNVAFPLCSTRTRNCVSNKYAASYRTSTKYRPAFGTRTRMVAVPSACSSAPRNAFRLRNELANVAA